MTKEEKNTLKAEYSILKSSYQNLKSEILIVPSESKEHYEILMELTGLAIEMKNIRRALIDSLFRRFYLSEIIDRFILGEKDREIKER